MKLTFKGTLLCCASSRRGLIGRILEGWYVYLYGDPVNVRAMREYLFKDGNKPPRFPLRFLWAWKNQ